MFASLKKLSLVALVAGGGLVAAGCQSSGGASAAKAEPASPATQAVMCSKCEVTWVKQPITAGGGKDWRILGYTSRKSHECPDCRSAVNNFFTTGKLEHTCKTCGDAMEVCHAK
jgi:hypothetical protein